MTNQIDESQFKLVTELIRRQDEALEQLENLCNRVEQAIEENVGSRDSEESVEPSTETIATEADQAVEEQDLKAA